MSIHTLNAPQQAAVTHLGSPLLVLAGAGSGKTRVITEKIAWLIRKTNHRAGHIAAITFTNKAAREMRERASKLLSKDEAKGLTIATFHTLGLKIIRRQLKQLGYQKGFSILDAQDSLALIKELALREELAEPEAIRWTISRWKNDFLSPEDVLQQVTDEQEQQAAQLYGQYQRQLKAYNAVDFDDLIVLPVRLFEQDPDILTAWQNQLRYLLVDEYQDTNACQYRLVQQLAGVRGALTVVGDDDQSIYAWRGARPENLHQLQRDYPTLKVIKLEQNYRSTHRILDSANHLIAHNPHQFEKKLWSQLGEGEHILVMPCRTAEHEAQKVITEMMKQQFRERRPYRDFAILYRGNHQSRLLEKHLRENRVPYRLTGGTAFFERAEVKDILAYLRLLANPDDNTAFLRIINTPRREIGASTLEKLADYAQTRSISLLKASREMGFAQRVSERVRERLDHFSQWFMGLMQLEQQLAPQGLAQRLVSDIDYEDWLLQNSSSGKMAEQRMDNVKELISWIEKLHDDGAGKESLSDIIAHMSLVDLLERQSDEGEEAPDAITLMTLHAAKGLEFPCVFLIGMEEELLPHANSMDQAGIEEERRLAYVGITRAQQQLTISYAKTRSRYGEAKTCEPSRFLSELPEKHLIWAERQATSPEEQQATAQAYLSHLRDLLAD